MTLHCASGSFAANSAESFALGAALCAIAEKTAKTKMNVNVFTGLQTPFEWRGSLNSQPPADIFKGLIGVSFQPLNF
jgi:hypothetical protein